MEIALRSHDAAGRADMAAFLAGTGLVVLPEGEDERAAAVVLDGDARVSQLADTVVWLRQQHERRPIVVAGVAADSVGHVLMAGADDAVLAGATAEETRARIEHRVRLGVTGASDSHRLFQAVFEATPESIAILSLRSHRFVDVNDRMLADTGFDRADLVGQHPGECGLWSSVEPKAAATIRLLLSGNVRDQEVEIRTRSGVRRTVLASTERVSVGGEPCMLFLFRDITDRKRDEMELRRSLSLLDVQLNASLDGFLRTDPGGGIVDFNDRLPDLFGLEPREDGSLPPGAEYGWGRVAPGEDFASLWERLQDHPDEIYRDELTLNNGKAVELYSAPIVTTAGEEFGRAWYYRDITERRRAEDERDRYFTQSIDLLAVFDDEGVIERANPAWHALLGYSEEELIGRPVFLFVHPDDRDETIAAARGTLEGQPITGLRVRMHCRDGSERWIAWNVTPVSESGYTYSIGRDVTDLVSAEEEQERLLKELEANNQALEEQARQLNQMRLKAEYAATHDALTGSLERRAWRRISARMQPTAVALFDIDDFKSINDTYGHPVGDQVLREVAWRMHAGMSVEAIIGRLGGEEFGALFRGPIDVAEAYCEHMVRSLSNLPIRLSDGTARNVTISCGLAPWNPGRVSREDSLDRTYADADAALYQAKHAGRNRLVVHGRTSQAAA